MNHGKTVLATALILAFLSLASAAPEASINDLPSEHEVGDGLLVKGSAVGSSLDQITIQVRDSGDIIWDHWRSKPCGGNTCSIERTYTADSSGTKEFKVTATEEDNRYGESEVKEVTFTATAGDRVDEVKINDLPSSVDQGDSFQVSGDAEGNSLDEIVIQVREDGETIWDHWRSKSCDNDDTCSIDRTYKVETSENLQFKISATAGSKYDDSGIENVEVDPDAKPSVRLFEPGDGELNVNRRPRFEWTVSDDEIDRVELWVEERDWSGDMPWNGERYVVTGDDSFRIPFSDRLDANRQYVWGIRAYDETGNRGEAVRWFETGNDDNRAPDLDLNSPLNTEVGPNPTLRWDSSDPDGDSVENTVYIDEKTRNDDRPWGSPIIVRNVGSSESYTVSRELQEGKEYVWGVETTDGDQTVRRHSYFTVREAGVCGVSVENIDLGDSIISTGESTTASVRVNNNGDPQEVRARIMVGSDTVLDRTRTIDNGRTFSTTISPSTDALVRAVVDTQGPPCGSETYSSSQEIIVTDGNGGDGDDDNPPQSEFTWSPSNPDAGEVVSFTSTSTDPDNDIVSYSWSFGDSSTAQGSTVQHTYSQGGTYSVQLQVEDSNGNTDTDSRQITVGEEPGACAVSVGELQLGDTIISQGESTSASIQVWNNGDPQQVIVTFREGTNQVTRQQVTLQEGQRTFSTQVSPADTELINVRVATVGNPCGSEEYIRSEELIVTGDGDATLTVHAENAQGTDLDNARVEVDGSVKRTGSDGNSVFSLSGGTYSVEVSRTGYNTRTRTVTLNSGDTRTMNFVLSRPDEDDGVTEDGNISITRIRHADTVCRGSTLQTRITVRNNDDEDRLASLTGTGLGSDIEADFEIESGESREWTFMFTNVQGSGTESFTITANGDSETRNVEVQNCPFDGTPAASGASSIAMTLQPDRAVSGQPVKVKGFVDGVSRRSEVTIRVDGSQHARVSTRPDGYYETYIRVEEVDVHTVSATSNGVSASRTLEILPTAGVNFIDPPRQVFEGEEFSLCAEVNSQITPKLLLIEDGEIIQTANQEGDVCFNLTAEQGEREYELRALTYGNGGSAEATVNVLENGVEASSFPSQIASVESGSGLVKIDIYNTNQDLRRYNLSLQGLPGDWVSQSEKDVVLASGERRTVYFYLTPKEEGTYIPELVVSSNGTQVYREDLRVVSGGTTEEQTQGFFDRLRRSLARLYSR